jgi:hypothetical protein
MPPTPAEARAILTGRFTCGARGCRGRPVVRCEWSYQLNAGILPRHVGEWACEPHARQFCRANGITFAIPRFIAAVLGA